MNDLKKNLIEASKTYFFGEISKYDIKYTASPIDYDDKKQDNNYYNSRKENRNNNKLSEMCV